MIAASLTKKYAWRSGLLLLALLFVTNSGSGYHPITDSGRVLHWGSGSLPVSYVIQAAGSDDVSFAATEAAIQLAFEQWQGIASSTITFAEDTAANAMRTDYGANDIHLILFDETDSTGLFPGNSATVALTPTTFDLASGTIIDSDIIFNGDDFTFSTNGATGTQDLQSIATHEIGHFIGLDHSAMGAATMYPFTADGSTVHRTLTQDDELGATDLYPGTPTFGSISGSVSRSTDASPIAGAHLVAVNDEGILVSSTYSDSSGNWVLDYLPPDMYNVYAEPLDLPVLGSNLSSDIGASTDTDFATRFLGGNTNPIDLTVTAGNDLAVGGFTLFPPGPFNITDSDGVPALLPRGGFASIIVTADNFDGVDETISVSGADITVFWSHFSGGVEPHYTMILQSLATVPLGPRYLEVRDSADDIAILSGFVEVVEAQPTLTNATPAVGSTDGGTNVTLTGTNFFAGATVFFDGVPAPTATVDSLTQISCTTPAGMSGTVTIVVQNSDGRVADLAAAFTFEGDPVITSLFPTGGDTAGATTVTIDGSGFEPAVDVYFDAVLATVTAATSTQIICQTPPGAAGAVDVRVVNPGGLFVDEVDGYTYMAIPDPTVSTFTPDDGPTAGGTEVSITGSGFVAGAVVTFDGIAATTVTVVSTTEITVTTPAGSAGTATVRVQNPNGSGAAASTAFTYMAPSGGGGGGGGGGCGALPPLLMKGNDPWRTLGLLLPYLLLITLLGYLRLRPRHDDSSHFPPQPLTLP
ncbi:MAG: IPT/TIG domain-containing protein [Planctomycetota bacterium]